MKNTRIALVQMNSVFGQRDQNLNKIKLFVKQAAKQQVDIICFPELSVQGYSRDKSHLYCEQIPGDSSNLISALARNHNITILAGIAEKCTAGNKPYITSLAALPDGSMEKYRKTHLGSSEKPYFTPGDRVPVFNTAKAVFGIQICWDLHFPEMSTVMSLKGAEIIFAPHASPCTAGSRKEIWLKYLTARAYDNTVYIAACNLIGGSGKDHRFSGGAMVIDPKGNVIAEDFNNQESMLVVDLDAELINKIRYQKTTSMRSIFYLQARRPELYKTLIKN
ncbi:putative amidohydrolase [Desulfohalotomaculum tongense]|uniref:nitrilase family protein n=1 Tax=Desulforadius tongensis TaxID=1216062 RepID=UPI00195ABE0B|nr:nitrilase family protein [Desulforadius tongensis]MBM7854850.1 putative amidohydrolase [Desulforadius tongensis]